jgi:hypothetical protein
MELQLQTQGLRAKRKRTNPWKENYMFQVNLFECTRHMEETCHKTSPYISHQSYTNMQASGSKDAKCNDLGANVQFTMVATKCVHLQPSQALTW